MNLSKRGTAQHRPVEGYLKRRDDSQKPDVQTYHTAFEPYMGLPQDDYKLNAPLFPDLHTQGHAAHHARGADGASYPGEYFLHHIQGGYAADTESILPSAQQQAVGLEYPFNNWEPFNVSTSHEHQSLDDNRDVLSSDSQEDDDQGGDPASRRRAANCVAARRHAQKKKKQVAEMEEYMAKLDRQINEEKKKKEKLLEDMHALTARIEMAKFQRSYANHFAAHGSQA